MSKTEFKHEKLGKHWSSQRESTSSAVILVVAVVVGGFFVRIREVLGIAA